MESNGIPGQDPLLMARSKTLRMSNVRSERIMSDAEAEAERHVRIVFFREPLKNWRSGAVQFSPFPRPIALPGGFSRRPNYMCRNDRRMPKKEARKFVTQRQEVPCGMD